MGPGSDMHFLQRTALDRIAGAPVARLRHGGRDRLVRRIELDEIDRAEAVARRAADPASSVVVRSPRFSAASAPNTRSATSSASILRHLGMDAAPLAPALHRHPVGARLEVGIGRRRRDGRQAPQIVAAVLGEVLRLLGGQVDEIEAAANGARLVGPGIARALPQRLCRRLCRRAAGRGQTSAGARTAGASRKRRRDSLMSRPPRIVRRIQASQERNLARAAGIR